MYKIFSFLLMSCLITVNTHLMSEEFEQPLTAMYIIPDSPCEFVTQGKPLLLQESPTSCIKCHGSKHYLTFSYDSYDNFSCSFNDGQQRALIPGVYKIDSGRSCGIYIGGFGRGGNSSNGEFEIFEIQFDKNDNLVSFAADFKVSTNHSGDYLRGAVRFNSSIPVDEYFLRMTNPIFNYYSEQLFYVKKQIAHSSDKKDIITEDRRDLHLALEENNGLDLIVKGKSCHEKKEVVFHVPNWDALINRNSFIIGLNIDDYSNDWSENQYDDFFFGNGRDDYYYSDPDDRFDSIRQDIKKQKQPSIALSVNRDKFVSEFGIFTISELTIDVKSKRVVSLALDFIFRDDRENTYEGTIRYNSAIPALLN